MQMLSLNDFISLKTRSSPKIHAKGVKLAKGSCHCGKVTFEVVGEPIKTVLCHCTNCRQLSGSTYSTNITVASTSINVRGNPKQFIFDSGQGPIFRVSFCGECSSTLWKESDAEGFVGYCLVQSRALGRDFDQKPHEKVYTAFRSKWRGRMETVEDVEESGSAL